MQRLIYQGAVNLNRLHEALAATPGLMQGDMALYMVDLIPGGIVLAVPDEIDGQTVADLIAAHDPTPDPEPEPETPPTEILLDLLADVTDVDETKPIIEAMLLMLGGQV